MRKLIIILLLIAAVVYFFTQRYSFVSGTSKEGGATMVMVDKKSGAITKLWGK